MTLSSLNLGSLVQRVKGSPKAAELKPAELRILDMLDAAAQAEAQAESIGRQVMAPADRKALFDENEADYAAAFGNTDSLAARIANATKRREALDEELMALYAEQAEDGGYQARRDARWRQQYEGRDPLVDQLVAVCRAEVQALWPPKRAELPARGMTGTRTGALVSEDASPYVGTMPTVVTNAESIGARQAALRHLAETVHTWGERGSYTDAADLRNKFEDQYRALPAVESLRDVVVKLAETDVWFKRFILRMPDGEHTPSAA